MLVIKELQTIEGGPCTVWAW